MPDTADDAQELFHVHQQLDALKVPRVTTTDDRDLTAAERLQLLVDHFNRQYAALDTGVLALANAIDAAWALIGGSIVTYRKTARAAQILKRAGQAIRPREERVTRIAGPASADTHTPDSLDASGAEATPTRDEP